MLRLDLLARIRDSLRARQQVFRTLPWRSQLLLYVFALCTFAFIGVLPRMTMLGAVPVRYVLLCAGVWGGVGVVVVLAGLRTIKFLPVAVIVIAGLTFIRWMPTFNTPSSIDAAGVAAARTNLEAIMAVTIGAIVIAYRGVFTLVTREGRRYWGAHAELQLAHGIHSALGRRRSR